MLPFFEELLEKKLSAALGADVTFDRVKLSPLSGKVDVLNLVARKPGTASPFLTVARIEAKIAMARALKQEIAIQSLRIERPMLQLPLPKLQRPASRATAQSERREPSKPWQFEADDVLIVDASVNFQNDTYHAIAEHATISLKRDATQISITIMVDSLGRMNPTVALGSLKATGTIATTDFARIVTSPISLDGALGSTLRVSARTASLQSKVLEAQADGDLDSELFFALMPDLNSRVPRIAGNVHFSIDGTFSPTQIKLRRSELSTDNATMEFEMPSKPQNSA